MEWVSRKPKHPMVIDGLLPVGLTVLGGESKVGKSFMALDLAYGVAAGASVFGSMVAETGDALYLALEDPAVRVIERLEQREPNRDLWPRQRLSLVTMDRLRSRSPRAIADEWVAKVPEPRLLILDTISRIGRGSNSRGGYQDDVDWMSRFQTFANEHGIAFLGITHVNQMKQEEGDDWFHRISGTTGITGTADQVMLLDVKRGQGEGYLRVDGRDVTGTDLMVTKTGPWWLVTDALRGALGRVQNDILDFVLATSGKRATTAEVSAKFGITSNKASQYLGRLVGSGRLVKIGRGEWGVA